MIHACAFIPSPLPSGFVYRHDWITPEDEQYLLTRIEQCSFSEVRMHGVIAKRCVIHFGWDYGYGSWTIEPTEPIPDWLMPLRGQAAALMGVPSAAIEEVLVTCCERGAGVGWHRDAPMFGPTVVGVSLLGPCRMRFLRQAGGRRETAEAVLRPRSSYVLSADARFIWQDSIPSTKEPRYSITFRTLNVTRCRQDPGDTG